VTTAFGGGSGGPGAEARTWPPFQIGRAFIHPLFDYLLIGGGLSLAATAVLVGNGPLAATLATSSWVAPLVFLSSTAHYAASTIRLYTKPGALPALPLLTLGFPLAAAFVLALAMLFPDSLGRSLQALYLTWLPYHYATQAFGLALMYCHRSGCPLTLGETSLLRLSCLAPFFVALLRARGAFLEWLFPVAVLAHPVFEQARAFLAQACAVAGLILPFAFLLRPVLRRRMPLPLISLVVVLSNGVWWVTLGYGDAFVWATIFHGLQYLCVAVVFHVRERCFNSSDGHGSRYHAFRFYLLSLALGYLLFQVWPLAGVAVGFSFAQSMLLGAAVINLHHFVVDAYIWRLRGDPNYQIVMGDAAADVPQPGHSRGRTDFLKVSPGQGAGS